MSAVEQARRVQGDTGSRRRRTVQLAVVAALLVATTTAVLTSAWVRHQLTLSFTRVPTPYTELYFAPDGPVASTAGTVTTVRLAVHSHEAEEVSYRYRVTASDGTTTAAAIGTVRLPPGAQQQVDVALDTTGLRWERIDVVLLDRPERIAWLRTVTNEVVPQ